MTSPLKFDVGELLNAQGADALPEQRTQTGPAPERIGVEMIAVAKGDEITVDATLTPLGSGVLVDATATGTLEGECVRCLRDLDEDRSVRIDELYLFPQVIETQRAEGVDVPVADVAASRNGCSLNRRPSHE